MSGADSTLSNSRKIRASVLYGPRDLKIDIRELPPPARHELQVAVRATGLCGSDLHYYKHYRNGDILVKEPLSLGHESAGVVVAVGPEVDDFSVGDRVALEVGVPCGDCQRCIEGRYNICSQMNFRSSAKSFPHFQGTLQERINHPAKWCYKLPENVSLELGALLEPLGVAIHANRRASLPQEPFVLVLGAGVVGLLTAAIAKTAQGSRVFIADIDQGRVKFAVDHGFAHDGFTIPARRSHGLEEEIQIAKETADEIAKFSSRNSSSCSDQFDTVFECTGVPSCVKTAIYATRPGGKVMLIGMGTPIQMLPLSAAALREVDLCGVFRYANTYTEAIEIVSGKSSNSPDFSKLVTHKFQGLESIEKAFNTASKTEDEHENLVLKVVVELNNDES